MSQKSPACFLNCNFDDEELTPSSIFFASNPTSTFSGSFLMFLSSGLSRISLYNLVFCFITSFKMIWFEKSLTRSPIVSAIKGIIEKSTWNPCKNKFIIPATVSKNFNFAANKISYIMLLSHVKCLFLLASCWLFFRLQRCVTNFW